MTTLPKPTPPPTDDTVQAVSPDTKERVLGGIGGFLSGATGAGGSDRGTPFHDSDLGRALEDHHSQRLAEAQMHQASVAKAGGALAQIQQGINPETGQRFNPNDPQDQVQMEQMRQFYEKQFNAAHDLFVKTAGVNKDTKSALQKGKMLLDHFLGIGQPAQQAAQGGGGGGPTPPPGDTSEAAPVSKAAPSPTNPDTRTIGQIASQETPVPAEPYDERSRARLSRTQEQMDFDRGMNRQKDYDKYLHGLKMEEINATYKARMASRAGTVPRPTNIRPVSVRDAKNMRDSMGSEFIGADGQPLDIDNLDNTMSLEGSFVAFTDPETLERNWKVVWTPFSPNQKVYTHDNVVEAVNPADVSKADAGTVKGEKNVPVTTATTDPLTRQTTVSKRTYQGNKGTAPATGGAAPTQNVPRGTSAPAQRTPMTAPPAAGGATPAAKAGPTVGGIPLDEGGLISSEYKGASPQVIEAANNLLSGMSTKDLPIPIKARGLAESLARKVGWDPQGFMTPLERRQVALTSSFIDDFAKSPSLKVMDDGAWNRMWLSYASKEDKEQTFVERLTNSQMLASRSLSADQQEFLRNYRQTVGLINGLGKLTRPGRATQADINRLISELPNPRNTSNSKDAAIRLQRIQREIDRFAQTGKLEFEEKAARRGAGPTPPPKGERKPLTELIPTQ